jgi:polysaccharide export outer membrane protein
LFLETIVTIRILLIAVCVLSLAAPVAHGQQEQSGRDEYLIQPGDVLQVSVWQEADLDHQVLVRPDGGISFPLVGSIDASGQTVEGLRGELSERLSRFIPDLSVTVLVSEINGNKVYVIGQVNQPGEFVVNPRVDVMQALSLAGGTTTCAAPRGRPATDDALPLRRCRTGQEPGAEHHSEERRRRRRPLTEEQDHALSEQH